MKIIKHLSFVIVDSHVVFRSPSEITLKIRAIPDNVAIQLPNSETLWCLGEDDWGSKTNYIDIYMSDVRFDDGEGSLQYSPDTKSISFVLSATQPQIAEIIRIKLTSNYISLNIAGNDDEKYLDGNFVLSKDDYPVHSWSMELPLVSNEASLD